MKCSAIYARVSSDKQKEEQTISSQTSALKAYAEAEGCVVPEEWVFEDEGYSGSILARPGLERIRDLAAEGEIEAVLVYSPDRLSRNYAYQTLLVEEFARQGVEVIFLKSPKGETPEDRLLLQFQGMIAEYERAQIAERSRRGKRHKAQAGVVNVLSGAPYGYRYHKRNEHVAAFYEVLEEESAVVREVYSLYIEEGLSINAIARHLNDKGIPTRSGRCRWERSTVWAMLRNPAYKGTACFGKTESTQRKKITRPLRQKGGYSPRDSSSRERPREDWTEIPVPAIVSEESYAMAQELLERNKQFASRNTKEPTLLQGLLVCRQCGYAFCRTSTRTSKRKLYYYRCIGSDNYRFADGRKCHNHPIRQDYLDELVWQTVIELLKTPALIQEEVNRRVEQARQRNPILKRQETLTKERARVQNGMDKLLDAYQESLLPLRELRDRMPKLQQRLATIESELGAIEAQALNQESLARISESVESFLERIEKRAATLDIAERQRILRLLVKQIEVSSDTIHIKHSIPVDRPPGEQNGQSYLLRQGSHLPTAGEHLSPLVRQALSPPQGSWQLGKCETDTLCGRLCRSREIPGNAA